MSANTKAFCSCKEEEGVVQSFYLGFLTMCFCLLRTILCSITFEGIYWGKSTIQGSIYLKPLNTATKCRCNFTLQKWLHSLKRNTKVWVTIRVQTIFHKTITFYTVNTKTPSYGHRVLVKLQQWDRIQNMI